MAIKKYKPTTPGRRGMTGLTFDEVTKSKPEKSLTVSFNKLVVVINNFTVSSISREIRMVSRV